MKKRWEPEPVHNSQKYLLRIYAGQTILLKLQLFGSTEVNAWLHPESSLTGTRQEFHGQPTQLLTLLLPYILKQGAAQNTFVLGWHVIREKLCSGPSIRLWWCYLKLQSDRTRPSTLQIPLSTHLESRHKVLHTSLETCADQRGHPAAPHSATKILPCKPNIESFFNPNNSNIEM